ncbi:hypothetical protein UACE39S_00335 [Ureibacillus acetophenoni]
MVNKEELIQRKTRLELKNSIVNRIAEEVDHDYLKLKSGELGKLKYFGDHKTFYLHIVLDEYKTQCFNLFNKTFNESYIVITPGGLRNIANEIVKKSKALQNLPIKFTQELIKMKVDFYISKHHSEGAFLRVRQDKYHYTPLYFKILTAEYIQKRIKELIDELSEGNIVMKNTYQDNIAFSYKYKTVLNELKKIEKFISSEDINN